MRPKILETLALTGPMGPSEIVSLFSPEYCLEEISKSLFDLMKEGEIDVNKDHQFFMPEIDKDDEQ